MSDLVCKNACFLRCVQMVGLNNFNLLRGSMAEPVTPDKQSINIHGITISYKSFTAVISSHIDTCELMYCVHCLCCIFVFNPADLCDCIISGWLHEAIYTVG